MNGRKNNLTNSSKFFFPLTVTKQEPKNNKDCRQKPRALCFREQRCHDSVFFCQRSVTANAKGPGPPRYKGQNQWSFGKTDGKPLADQWAGWRGEEPGGGGPAERHHIICVTTSSSRHHHVPSSVWWATKKPPELQQPGQYRSDFPETTSKPERRSQNVQRHRSKQPRTHISLTNECTQKRKQRHGGYGQLILHSPTSNCKVKLLFTGEHSLSAS